MDLSGVNLTTIIKRLEAATSRLEDIADAGQSAMRITHETRQGASGGSVVGERRESDSSLQPTESSRAGSMQSVPSEMPKEPIVVEEDPASVKAYDELFDIVREFVGYASEIGGEVKDQATSVDGIFEAQRAYLLLATKAKKPDMTSPAFAELLKPTQSPLQDVMNIREKNRASPFFNHLSAIAEGIPALGWVAVEPTPAPYVGDMRDSAQFYANRVIKDWKEKEGGSAHVKYVQTFLRLLSELQKYVKQWHTTGVVWNPKGEEASALLAKAAAPKAPAAPPAPAGGAPPPPPPPPPPGFFDAPAPAAAAPAADMNSVFAQLNQGEGITSSLKKVDKSQMTHKNPTLRATSAVPDRAEGRKSPAPPAKPQALQQKPKKPAKKELDGTQWIIENWENVAEPMVIDAEINQTVFIVGCTGVTIQIKGKVNAVSVASCTKTNVVVDSLVSSFDLVKCKSFALQVLDKAPTIIADQCDSGLIYLSQQGLDVEILTSQCSSININVPGAGEDGDYAERAVAEQFKTVIKNGTLETTVVEHAG
ncbi:suppressor of rasval19 [Saitoella coloradoensis]